MKNLFNRITSRIKCKVWSGVDTKHLVIQNKDWIILLLIPGILLQIQSLFNGLQMLQYCFQIANLEQ